MGALAARLHQRSVADELFLRARSVAERLAEPSLVEVLGLCEQQLRPQQAQAGEAQRSAARVVSTLNGAAA
jgi:hypothetical protein